VRMGTVFLVIEAAGLLSNYKCGVMPSSSWFDSCHRHISAVISHIANALCQVHHSKKNNQVDHYISLQYTSFVLLLTLTEINEILERHPFSPECQDKCKFALQTVARLLDDLSGEDFQYLSQVIGAYWDRVLSVWADKSAMTRTWYPNLPPHSIFDNASLFLMASSKNKLASIRLDFDALPVCERLEQDMLVHHLEYIG